MAYRQKPSEKVIDGSVSAAHAKMSAYFPSRVTVSQAPRRATVLKLGLFVFFVLTRALHPMLIDMSKRDGKILYAKNTPVVMNKILTVVLMNLLALLSGGWSGVRLCWQPRCLIVFGLIGTVYALGDFLEMLSMATLTGGVYQVLLQTKLMITALMCWWLKGSRQTALQWHVLFSMFLAMSSFVLVDQGGESGGAASLPLLAVACVMLKVVVSCYCAVLSEKYLKAFSDMPLFAKISSLSTTWALTSLLLCGTEPQVASQGFFAHWDSVTWLVTWSFVVKTVSTMYLLQALDSVQKNIGEALAVIVIYVAQVAMAGFSEAFELSVFLLAVLVVALVKTYLIAPKPEKRAVPTSAAAKRMKLVSLNTEGTPLMQNLGVNTMTCEVSGLLPAGVFYGMLGGVHPVCGSTHPSSPKHAELVMLAHAPVDGKSPGPASPVSQQAPFMPCQSLTVLGHVRDPLPRAAVSAEQTMKDVAKAREHLLDKVTGGGGLSP